MCTHFLERDIFFIYCAERRLQTNQTGAARCFFSPPFRSFYHQFYCFLPFLLLKFFSLAFYAQAMPLIQQSWLIVWGILVLESIFFIKGKKVPLFLNNLLTIVVLQLLFFAA